MYILVGVGASVVLALVVVDVAVVGVVVVGVVVVGVAVVGVVVVDVVVVGVVVVSSVVSSVVVGLDTGALVPPMHSGTFVGKSQVFNSIFQYSPSGQFPSSGYPFAQ